MNLSRAISLPRAGKYLGAMLSLSAALSPQQVAMSLAEAVENPLRNDPSVRVSQEQVNAAAAAIQLARTAYLPRVDALAQVNRATRNNVFGMLLPQSVIPSISSPVIGQTTPVRYGAPPWAGW
jgi:outer membrane protein TolC